jgi:hypothetical protein
MSLPRPRIRRQQKIRPMSRDNGPMVLNVGTMNDDLNSKPSVSTRRCPGTLNVLACVAAQRIERGSPFCAPLPFVFGDGCGLSPLAHRDIRLVADALQCGVPSVSSGPSQSAPQLPDGGDCWFNNRPPARSLG